MKSPLTIDIYDFDYTIYDGDSSLDFYLFCLRKQPSLLRFFPRQVGSYVLFVCNVLNRDTFKSEFFVFLRGIQSVESMVSDFWGTNHRKLKAWYVHSDHTHDVIISASPEFLLAPISSKLQVYGLLATLIDTKTGRLVGKNCHGEEKVTRLKQEYGNANVDQAFADSESDIAMLKLAKQQFIVRKNQIIPYDEAVKSSGLKLFVSNILKLLTRNKSI